MRKLTSSVLPILFVCALFTANPSEAANNCVFATTGSVITLIGDCTTDSTIHVPDGMTLDGNGHTLTAVNPSSGPFLGAVVRNAGASASVLNLTVTTMDLTGCAGGDGGLRGILFEGAAGRIAGNTVMNINRGASGCQEANAIEVRNAPFDLTRPDPLQVIIEQNDVMAYQKTGIVANGNVTVAIRQNKVGSSATQGHLAANSVQVGFGAQALVEHNHIAGNSWTTNASWASTAILVYQAAAGTIVRQNNLMEGNADVGIWIESSGVIVDNNRVFESGSDGAFDIGIGNWGSHNSVTNNKIRGYQIAVDGDSTGTKAIPSPHEG